MLVVDDVAANRFLYRALLEDDGHRVREAADGASALRAVEAEGEVPMPEATVRVTVSLVQAVAPPLGD